MTVRVCECSPETRADYLARIGRARREGPMRKEMSCVNLAHAFAVMPIADERELREARKPAIAIVSAYNDMLSAH